MKSSFPAHAQLWSFPCKSTTTSLVTQVDVPTTPVDSPTEIPVSTEMIFPDGRQGFQYDAGVERFGGPFTLFEKNNMRISLKAIYGPTRLDFDLFGETAYGWNSTVDSFDQILLRNGSQDAMFSILEFPRILGADQVTVKIEVSHDLLTWTQEEATFLDQSTRLENTAIQRWHISTDTEAQKFARVVITPIE